MVAWEERHLFFSGATAGRMFIYVLIHVPVNNSDETHVCACARAHTDTRRHEHIRVSGGVNGIHKRVIEDEFVKNTSFCICVCVCMKMS